jgi:mono/diheme cytochrome c family protein
MPFARGNDQTTVVTSGLLVTQFAVPVAVPQYVATVAPPSYVQYGSGYSTSSTETLEDRIAAKVIQGLQASGNWRAAGAAPTLVAQSCARCHSGPTPNGKLDLSVPSKLAAEDRLRAIRAVLADDEARRMPPASSGVKLSAEEVGKVLQELSQSLKEVKP